jgi:hypothetical protein
MDSLRLLPCLDSDERAARCRVVLLIPWERAAELGRTAVAAAATGGYRDAVGRLVDWGEAVARAPVPLRAACRQKPSCRTPVQPRSRTPGFRSPTRPRLRRPGG